MVGSGKRIVLAAATCASWAFSIAAAAPPKSIKFDPETGALDPAGAMPFDQWISATSSTPIKLPDGTEIAPLADFQYCRGSQRSCLPKITPKSICGENPPITADCSLPITVTPAADGKGVIVRAEIPPLQYNSAYRLVLSAKKTIRLTRGSLQSVQKQLQDRVRRLVESKDSPSALEICRSLKADIEAELSDRDIRFGEPLSSCAANTASIEQIATMEKLIEDSINSRIERTEAEQNGSPAETISDKRQQDESAQRALENQVQSVMTEVVQRTDIWAPVPLGTSANAATTRALHVSMDAGLVYAWDLDESLTYFGANIYSRPVNTDVSLASLKAEGLLTWRHRLSVTIGATLESIEKPGQRKGIVGSNALVVGVGYRLTDVIRISAGALVFEEENPNPLVTNDTSLAVSPYVAISFDIDVAKNIGKIFPTLP